MEIPFGMWLSLKTLTKRSVVSLTIIPRSLCRVKAAGLDADIWAIASQRIKE